MPASFPRLVSFLLALLHSITTTPAASVSVGGNHYNRVDRQWREKKRECEQRQCQQFSLDEGMNCVNECLSLECFNQVYAHEPLEDGEIDSARNREFVSCLRRTYRKVLFPPIVEESHLSLDEESPHRGDKARRHSAAVVFADDSIARLRAVASSGWRMESSGKGRFSDLHHHTEISSLERSERGAALRLPIESMLAE